MTLCHFIDGIVFFSKTLCASSCYTFRFQVRILNHLTWRPFMEFEHPATLTPDPDSAVSQASASLYCSNCDVCCQYFCNRIMFSRVRHCWVSFIHNDPGLTTPVKDMLARTVWYTSTRLQDLVFIIFKCKLEFCSLWFFRLCIKKWCSKHHQCLLTLGHPYSAYAGSKVDVSFWNTIHVHFCIRRWTLVGMGGPVWMD